MTAERLRPMHVDGFRMEAWNEQDATVKNNVLTANAAENMEVPVGAKVVRLQATVDLWYHLTATAVLPTDDTSDDTLLPAGVERWISLRSITNISLISSGTPKVCGLFWS